MSIYFDTTPIESIDKALGFYDEKEFRSPMRSTVPLLSWLKHEWARFSRLASEMGMPADSDLHFEYGVAPGGEKGQPSRTDLMLKASTRAVAIEAKWTEPRYETVREWLKSNGDESKNRVAVLNGWLSLLRQGTGRATTKEAVADVVYQMVHRAASACAAGEANSAMAYLIFKPSESANTATAETIKADLGLLRSKLGCPDTFPFYVVEVGLKYTPAFEAIRTLNKGDSETSPLVREALLDARPLFEFEDFRLSKVADH